MSEQLRQVTQEKEASPRQREEVASASDVVQAMIRTAKGLRMYLPNNPVLIKFAGDLSAKMALHTARFGELRLDVERFALRCRGVDLYQNQDVKESIAFRLYADGVRTLLFAQGIRQHELLDFLDLIALERPGQQDEDDIVTQLWEKSLPHIDYLLEEDLLNVRAREPVEEVSQQESLSRIYRFIAENSPLPPRVASRQLLVPTDDEAEWLRRAMLEEEQANPLADVIAILSAVLVGGREPSLFHDFSAIMAKLAGDMLLLGEISQALQLIRFLDTLQGDPAVGPEQQQRVRELLPGILSEGAVQVLQQVIDSSDRVAHKELRELLLIFGVPSLASIAELLGRVEKLKMRKVIIEVMVELGRDDPEVFAPFLADPRWYLVRNIVLILALVGSPEALKMIIGLISHREARIRKEVLGYLERASDPKAKAYILKFLRDESSGLRIKALQLLARERQLFALKPIIALTTGEDFKSKVLAEKKAVYQAIGELGGEATLPIFQEMLLKRSWFNKTVDRETALCAVAGLQKMKGAAALTLLKEARKQQSAEIRGIIDQAISVLEGAAEKETALPEEV